MRRGGTKYIYEDYFTYLNQIGQYSLGNEYMVLNLEEFPLTDLCILLPFAGGIVIVAIFWTREVAPCDCSMLSNRLHR